MTQSEGEGKKEKRRRSDIKIKNLLRRRKTMAEKERGRKKSLTNW